MSKDKAISNWIEEVDEWWDDNQIQDMVEDPPGEAMYDAFAFIAELIKIKNRRT